MPTRKRGDDVQENAIRFRNLLDEAEGQLIEGGMRRPEAKDLLAPARALVEDEVFWQEQSDGLAVFIARDFARKYHLPLELKDKVVVADRFHVKPLLSVLSNNGRFYVLTLSQHEIRLLEATRHQIGEIDLDDREQVPETIADVLKWEDPEMRLHHHTTTEATLHHGAATVFHGHGVASQDDPKEKVLRYFHRLDDGVSSLLADDDAPLVPVADGYILARYRAANSYPHLVEEGVEVVPDQFGLTELHRRAWALVQPLFRQAEEQARDTYHHLRATEAERTSDDVEEVVQAAAAGRVEGLFVSRDQEIWGRFDRESGLVETHDEQQPGDHDLLDIAAVQTMLHDGWLFMVGREDAPDTGPLAAVFRW